MEHEERKLKKKVSKARCSANVEDVIQSCRRLAEFQSRHGRYEDALATYREELAACRLKGDERNIAQAHRMIGEMCCTLGMFEESLSHVNDYLTFSKDDGDSVEEQRALATIGRTYFCWAVELQQNMSPNSHQLTAVLKDCRKAYMKSLYICEQELTTIGNRERQEMKARLLFNLGLACEVEGELKESLNFIYKAVSICKQDQLLEDLHRCYTNLVTINLKTGDIEAALRSADEAIDIAKRLSNDVELTVLALFYKAEVYFAMGNFSIAKKVLKKAYKLRTPNDDDRKGVELSLKHAVLLCDLENKLLATPTESIQERKTLYEKLGDTCCSIKNYKHAIRYYLNMLECSQTLGEIGTLLLPCYVSLSQTYRDDKNLEQALYYARKELEISKEIPVEAAKTHINIGEILDMNGASYFDISAEYIKAIEYAKEAGNDVLLASSLRRLAATQRANNKTDLAAETQRQLDAIGTVDSSESENGEDDEVHLSDLSDTDEEVSRSGRNTYRVTRNEKGETPLHTAAINGDVTRARRLISMGHPVKERDLAGWTPLHEAANHGHIDLVKLLVEAGADVNDPGGKECGGVTPLHDSASCGHFDIIRYIMNHGGIPTVLTNTGETPLDCLKQWRERIDDLDDESQNSYEALTKDLQASLTAAGMEKSVPVSRVKIECNSSIEGQVPLEKDNKMPVVDLRRRTGFDIRNRQSSWRSAGPEEVEPYVIEDNPQSSRDRNNLNKSVSGYKEAINAIRKRPLPIETQKPLINRPAPLLDADNYVDEWLDDDLGVRQNQKKNKRKINDLLETANTKHNTTVDINSPVKEHLMHDDLSMETGNSRKKSKHHQVTNEVTDTIINSPSLLTDNSFEFPSAPSPPFSSVSDHNAPAFKVRVNVKQHKFLIAIDRRTVEELTVRWLSEQAAKRYCSLEGREPKIMLKTTDGAILEPTDPLTVALGEELQATVLSWKTTRLIDRYRDACLQEEPNRDCLYEAYVTGPDTAVCSKLNACSFSRQLDLKYMALTESEFKPILFALRHEGCLQTMDLTGNVLGDDGVKLLIQCFQNCSTEQLILSCNNITSAGLAEFSEALDTLSNDFWTALRTIDLSFNPLGDIGKESAASISSRFPNLSIKTEYCDLP